MLGVIPEVNYPEESIDLGPGDRLCFYTDGVLETLNSHGESFGMDRLSDVVCGRASLDAAELLQQITVELAAFRGDQPPPDDVTVLVAQIK
jgi:sigma-B regulation protein RsbU (phosphoserine phosphatase)